MTRGWRNSHWFWILWIHTMCGRPTTSLLIQWAPPTVLPSPLSLSSTTPLFQKALGLTFFPTEGGAHPASTLHHDLEPLVVPLAELVLEVLQKAKPSNVLDNYFNGITQFVRERFGLSDRIREIVVNQEKARVALWMKASHCVVQTSIKVFFNVGVGCVLWACQHLKLDSVLWLI